MTAAGDLLVDSFGRIKESVHEVVPGLTPEQLAYRPDPQANSIAWLVWHLTRVQDVHVADIAGTDQVWTAEGWYDRFAFPFPPEAHGYGHTSEDVGNVQVSSGELLTAYYDAVHEKTLRFIAGISDDDLARIVDDRWDPPVTLAVRLVSVIDDDAKHVGQAAYVRGIVERRSR